MSEAGSLQTEASSEEGRQDWGDPQSTDSIKRRGAQGAHHVTREQRLQWQIHGQGEPGMAGSLHARGSQGPADVRALYSGLDNYGRTRSSCLQPPGLWQLDTAALFLPLHPASPAFALSPPRAPGPHHRVSGWAQWPQVLVTALPWSLSPRLHSARCILRPPPAQRHAAPAAPSGQHWLVSASRQGL